MIESDSERNDHPQKHDQKQHTTLRKKRKTCLKLCPAPVVKSIPQSGIKRQHVIKRGRSGTSASGKLQAKHIKHQIPGSVMPRSFPPLWLYLSLSHTGLNTSNVSNSKGKYSAGMEPVFPSSHSENTSQDTCNEQQGKGGEGVSMSFRGIFHPQEAPQWDLLNYYFSYNLKYSRSTRSTERVTAVRTGL